MLSSIIFIGLILPLYQTQQTIDPVGVPLTDVSNAGYKPDGSMDLTFAKSAQQKNQFIDNAGRVQPGTNFLQHLFEADGDDEFHFTLPVEQQIAFYIYAYTVQGNQYVRVKDVSVNAPVRLFLMEGNDMIVRNNFYFQTYVVFNGKKGIKYTIKIQTNGEKKLLSLSLKLFVEEADIMQNLKTKDTHKYSRATHNLKSELLQLGNKFGVYRIINETNMRESILNVRRYLRGLVFEMIILGLASYIQVRTLFKLLKTNSIVV